ncbi:hypothetical protein [Dulcicalothrix desertica]|uniref:hypothetical protein n=1 Tax=Dulcicalothrix desertica TaxID=32056 RepID=UPI000F8F14C3|nr:hypothetical protein [Dulcicalothrix desertica]TWH54705.1 hypothetical protein CAL7102_02758 [Dulcicalothrix desertica PCC 7102]
MEQASLPASPKISSYLPQRHRLFLCLEIAVCRLLKKYLKIGVLRITLTGQTRVIAKLPGATSGIALESPGVYIVAVNRQDVKPATSLWRTSCL